MKKSSNVFSIHETLLESRKNLYTGKHTRKKKAGQGIVIDSSQYEADEYQDNPQAFFTRLEHWSLDGG